MKWPFRQRQQENDPDQQSVTKQIEQLLFPPFENHRTGDGIEYCIDRSIDTNLLAALVDIEEGYVDEIVLKSIKDSIDVLESVRKLLNVKQEMVDDPSMLVVAPPIK